jgi:serine/threonine protein kinase/tetratricopeptide (TPR) repeat protein
MERVSKDTIMIGQTVSHYEIIERLGGGGMGVVYKAKDLRLDRFVALKFLPADLTRDSDAKQRFVHEAKSASALDHTNICTIHEIDETPDGQIFIVMAFYDGETVKKKIERGPLKLDEAVGIGIQVAQGLAKAHESGMIHRDIKPANVMVTCDGIAKIVDFGLAKLTGMSRITRTGTSVGTVGYMSPEQAQGEPADHRSDIWSLGAMLYEMVTGQRPFRGDYDNAVMYSILNAQPEPMTGLRTGVPMELERIVGKAMAKSPAERYQHIDELLVDLNRVRREAGQTVTQMSAPAVTASRRKKTRWKRIVVPTAMFLGLVAAFFLLKPALFDEVLVSEPKPIAVVSFTNQTGDRAYDYLSEAIPNLLISSLEQSRYLRVMTFERMRDLLDQMGKKDVRIIDKDLGFELCRREGVQAIVVGSFVKGGETFATDVKVLDVNTKELLKSVSARGEGVQSILNSQIDELSREIARGVGLSQRKVESSATQIAQSMTPSMDAYNFFLRGREDFEKFYYASAAQFLEKAVALDTNFAVAYLYLARTRSALLEPSATVRAIQRAMALSSRAPDKDRLSIEARYATAVERNPEKRRVLVEELVGRYPREKRFHDELGQLYQGAGMVAEAQREYEKAIELDPIFASPVNGLAYMLAAQGLYDRAIETLQRYASLSPGDANPFDSMGEMYLLMGNLDESATRYREAIRVKPDFHSAYCSLGYVYALKEEYAEAIRSFEEAAAIAPSPLLRALSRIWKSIFLRMIGRVRESVVELDSVYRIARRAEPNGLLSPWHWMRASFELERGDPAAARMDFLEFARMYARNSPSTPVRNEVLRNAVLSHVDLQSGWLDSARIHATAAKSRIGSLEPGLKPVAQMVSLFDAEVLLAEGLADSAIHVVRETPVMGPSMSYGWFLPLYNTPAMRDIVPRAFVKKGMLDSAIVEYERLLRIDSGTRDRRFLQPLFHYRLARICEEAGRREKALSEYRRFLEIWKDADKDRPELLDAKKRVANLKPR